MELADYLAIAEILISIALIAIILLQVKGEGLPDIRTKRRGSLLVQFLVEIPRKQTEKWFWVAAHLERWKKVIDFELIQEIRRLKKKYDY